MAAKASEMSLTRSQGTMSLLFLRASFTVSPIITKRPNKYVLRTIPSDSERTHHAVRVTVLLQFQSMFRGGARGWNLNKVSPIFELLPKCYSANIGRTLG